MKRNIFLSVIIAFIIVFTINIRNKEKENNISVDSNDNSYNSNIIITLYDNNGEEIKMWDGGYTILDTTNGIHFINENNKEVLCVNGIVVVEEK